MSHNLFVDEFASLHYERSIDNVLSCTTQRDDNVRINWLIIYSIYSALHTHWVATI